MGDPRSETIEEPRGTVLGSGPRSSEAEHDAILADDVTVEARVETGHLEGDVGGEVGSGADVDLADVRGGRDLMTQPAWIEAEPEDCVQSAAAKEFIRLADTRAVTGAGFGEQHGSRIPSQPGEHVRRRACLAAAEHGNAEAAVLARLGSQQLPLVDHHWLAGGQSSVKEDLDAASGADGVGEQGEGVGERVSPFEVKPETDYFGEAGCGEEQLAPSVAQAAAEVPFAVARLDRVRWLTEIEDEIGALFDFGPAQGEVGSELPPKSGRVGRPGAEPGVESRRQSGGSSAGFNGNQLQAEDTRGVCSGEELSGFADRIVGRHELSAYPRSDVKVGELFEIVNAAVT